MPFPKRARPRAPTTTPIFDQSIKMQLYGVLVKAAITILIPLGVLLWSGHPALRIGYTWNGHTHSPLYYQCRYLTYDGIYRLIPNRPGDPCPLITFLPFDFSN